MTIRARVLLISIVIVELGQAGVILSSAGSTFIYPMILKWSTEYRERHPDVEIRYRSTGSGNGIRQVIEGTVDFGATDAPLNDHEMQEFKKNRDCDVLHIPAVLGADVPVYNLPNVIAELNFTPEALAGIFLGKITQWNDSELTKANPRVKLPNHRLTVVHRSDGSGTTYVWADYLAKISREWKQTVGVGTSVNWPVGIGEEGNEGVSKEVAKTSYSIGYVELIYALRNHLDFGRVRNSSNVFVRADLDGITAAAGAAAARGIPDDFRVSITDAPGKSSYPICGYTWFLIPSKISDPAKKDAIVEFLHWTLTTGQNVAGALAYARLPEAVRAKALNSSAAGIQ